MGHITPQDFVWQLRDTPCPFRSDCQTILWYNFSNFILKTERDKHPLINLWGTWDITPQDLPEPTEGRDDYSTKSVGYSETLTTIDYQGDIGQNEVNDTHLEPSSRWSSVRSNPYWY